MGLANIAATNMEHLCNCSAHGYSQEERWGNSSRGACKVQCEGHESTFLKGDRDCSSAVCDSWQEALIGTPYEGALAGATYTGNMRSVFTGSGLFEWKPMSFTAQRGDIYLSEANHTAMCVDDGRGSYGYDALAEFSINENGGITGGQPGDQTARESYIHGYYDFPWDGILHYNGKADGSQPSKPAPSPSVDIDALAQAVIDGKYGNGDERRAALGDRYDAVQARVNEILGGGASSGASSSDDEIDRLAREVIDGKYGNGQERIDALGSMYAAVQARVNELLR